MILNMLRNTLFSISNINLSIPIICYHRRILICKMIICSCYFWLTSNWVWILSFKCCIQVFSIHSIKSWFSLLSVLLNNLIKILLNFLFLRNWKHEWAFIGWRNFSFRTFLTLIKLFLNREFCMILVNQWNEFLFLSLAVNSSVNIFSLNIFDSRFNRLTSCF